MHSLKQNLSGQAIPPDNSNNLIFGSSEANGLALEVQKLKDSMRDMMELVVDEIDGIKREMYLEFGGNHKLLFGEVTRIGGKLKAFEEWQGIQIEREQESEK